MVKSTPPGEPARSARGSMRATMALFYLAAGIIHLAYPAPFLGIMPRWVPNPADIVAFTGVCEIVGAVGLLWPPTRRAAGIALAAYAVCVYPANVQHAVNDLSTGTGLGLAYHLPRLALQPVIAWWALFCSGVVDWPFSRRRER